MWILIIAANFMPLNIHQMSSVTIGGIYNSQELCQNAKSNYQQNQAFCVKSF